MFDSGTYLTKRQADTLYLSIGYISVISLLEGVTPGIAQSSKVLALGASKQVAGLGQFTWTDTNDAIQISNASTSGRSNLKMINDVSDFMEYGIRGSLASNPRTAYIYTNGAYRHLMDLQTGDSKYLSTTQSINSGSGALTIDGGVGIAKNCYVGGSLAATGGISTSSTVSATGNVTTSGVFSAVTSSSSSLFKNVGISGSLSMTSGASIYLEQGVKTGLLSITNTGSNQALTLQSPTNSSSTYGVLNVTGAGMCYQRSTGSPALEATCPLDFGSTLAQDMIINLYGGTYGIGASDSALKLLTGGVNGFQFSRGSGYAESTPLGVITYEGSYQATNGIRACGYDYTGYSDFSGPGVELYYSGGRGAIICYNRNTLLYKPLDFNNIIKTDGLGHMGIGMDASTWLLEVSYNTQSVSSYGYLNSSGAVGSSAGSTGNVNFSAKFNGRIAVSGEIDVYSDARLKTDIRSVTQEEAESFFNVEPKWYVYCKETSNERQYGYLAQDLAKAGLTDVVCCREDLEKELPEHIDSDGFVSPENTIMSVSYPKLVALLHQYVKLLEERVSVLEKKRRSK